MADKEKRIKVSVDGTGAERDIGRIAAAFNRLNASIASAGASLSRFQSSAASAMARVNSSIAGVGNQLRGGLNRAIATTGHMFQTFGRTGSASIAVVAGAIGGLISSTFTFMNVFRMAMRNVLFVGAGLAAVSTAIADAGIKTDRYINTLVILTGSTAEAKEELQGLFQIADKLGTSFTAAATPFTKFAAAAAGSMSRPEISGVFESFAKVGTALQLSQNEVTGVFLALQQIASKGTVSMEELRLQLAERIPGAMRLAAASMNMSMSQFEKAVADRTINAADFLKRFSSLLSEVFGQAAELSSTRLFAGIQRLTNSFFAFRQEIFASGFESGLKRLVEAADAFLRRSPDLARAIGQASEAMLTRFANTINNIDTNDIVSAINSIITAVEALVNVLKDVSFHMKRFFNDEFDLKADGVDSSINTLNQGLARRKEILDQLASGTRESTLMDRIPFIENDRITSDMRRVGLTIQEKSELLAEFNSLSAKMGDIYTSNLQENLEATGLALNIDLSQTSLEQLQELFDKNGFRLSSDTANVSIPRLTASSQPITGLNLGGIPETSADITGNAKAVQALTDQMLSNEVPGFFESLGLEDYLSQMDELDVLSHRIEATEESRAILLDKITRQSEALKELRTQELDVNGENLANQTRLQNELIQSMERHADISKELNALTQDQNDLLEKRQKEYQAWLQDQTMVRLAAGLGDAFAFAFEDAIVNVNNFRDALKSLAEDVVRLTTRLLVTEPLSKFLASFIGGMLPIPGGQMPSNIVDPFNSPGMAGAGIMNAHTGASFKVPGAGGVDSKLIRMKVTPGERINVEPLNRQNSSSGSGRTINAMTKVEVHNHTGAAVSEETSRQSDGSTLTKIIIGAVTADLMRGGDIAQTMRTKFGVSPATSRR